MSTQKLDQKRALTWRILVTFVLIIAALYVVATHWQTVSVSVRASDHARIGWLLTTLFLMVGTFFVAAFTYQVLALRRLQYRQTLLIEVAGAFVGRLLPAGLGGLGLNGVYLYKRKHTPAEATAVISINNLLGMCAHGLLIVLLFVCRPNTVQSLATHYHVHLAWPWILLALFVVSLCAMVPLIRMQVIRFCKNLFISLHKEKPIKLFVALLSAVLLTVTYTLMLFCTSHALGIGLGVTSIFVIFSIGMLLGTATPTPGGLVGTEAGLFAGFASFGVSPALAGAAVLLFRLITYWLPIVPGASALLWARKRKLL